MGKDPRPLLRTVYDVFGRQGLSDPSEILEVAESAKVSSLKSRLTSQLATSLLPLTAHWQSAHDEFYSLLYVALWHESEGNEEHAKKYMLQAIDTR